MLQPTRFMRIPFFVSGHQVTTENLDAIAKWCEGHVIRDAERPFVRVPVIRPTNKKQTEAYIGTWVIVSVQRGERSFKVYTEEWLRKQFFEIPREALEDGGLLDINGSCDEKTPSPTTPAAFRPPNAGSMSLPHQKRAAIENHNVRDNY